MNLSVCERETLRMKENKGKKKDGIETGENEMATKREREREKQNKEKFT